jgi:tRNA dimethylallyltransferase
MNLQEFRAEAEAAIAAEHARRGVAFLVGGSGLYLKAITQGLEPRPWRPSPAAGPVHGPGPGLVPPAAGHG